MVRPLQFAAVAAFVGVCGNQKVMRAALVANGEGILALGGAGGMPGSSHLFPEVSAPLLAVSPACHWLEYVDWASPILQEPFKVENGHATAPDKPGIGIAWDEARVAVCLAQ
mgnify:CR=1 FL=1